MSNRIPSRGNFNIPSSLIIEYEWMTDSFIDDLGKECKLIYPPKDSECPNCYYSREEQHSTNIYKTNGPYPFDNYTTCPMCAGIGRSQELVTETVKLRVYTTPKDFIDVGANILFEDGLCQIIGYMADLPKIERAIEIVIFNDLSDIKEWKFQPSTAPMPWGLGSKPRYFIMYCKRNGGG